VIVDLVFQPCLFGSQIPGLAIPPRQVPFGDRSWQLSRISAITPPSIPAPTLLPSRAATVTVGSVTLAPLADPSWTCLHAVPGSGSRSSRNREIMLFNEGISSMSTRVTQRTRSPGFLGQHSSRVYCSCRFFVSYHRTARFLEFPVSGPIHVNAGTFGVWNSAHPVSPSHPVSFFRRPPKLSQPRPPKRSGVTVSSEIQRTSLGPRCRFPGIKPRRRTVYVKQLSCPGSSCLHRLA
jgi:hypothetical protein